MQMSAEAENALTRLSQHLSEKGNAHQSTEDALVLLREETQGNVQKNTNVLMKLRADVQRLIKNQPSEEGSAGVASAT